MTNRRAPRAARGERLSARDVSCASRRVRRSARSLLPERHSARCAARRPRPPRRSRFPTFSSGRARGTSSSIYQASVGVGARVVAVIGVEAGDGASACARALAERSALAPSRTLLVDASESRRTDAPTWEPEPENIGWFKLSDGEDDPFRLRSPDTLRRLWAEAHKDWETVIIDCAPGDRGPRLPRARAAHGAKRGRSDPRLPRRQDDQDLDRRREGGAGARQHRRRRGQRARPADSGRRGRS